MKTDLTVCLLVAVVYFGSMTDLVNSRFFKKHGINIENGKSWSTSKGKQMVEDESPELISHELYTRNVRCTACGPEKDHACNVCGLTGRCRWVLKDPNTHHIISCCYCSCFPSTSSVSLENGQSVTISQLQVGDRVQTVSSEGNVKYSEVRTFMEKNPTTITMYKSVRTSSNETISLTGNHLIFARKRANDKFNAIYADQLSIGDEVLAQGNHEFTSVRVTNIFTSAMQGAFVPVTMDGTIMVDGVLASCYAFSDHYMAHLGMMPFRWFPQIMDWIFGVDYDFGYIKLLESIGRWVLPQNLMF